jgi:hypothetical protein
MVYLLWVFKDKKSWFVFALVFLLSLWGFKVIPQGEDSQITLIHAVLGVVYSLLFALLMTCLFKTLWEKIKELLEHKKPHAFLGESREQFRRGERLKAVKTFAVGLLKFLVVFAGILGLGAAQFCVFGSPVCGVSVGAGLIMAIFPSAAVHLLVEYAKWIIAGAILLQILGLYLMGCFKRVRVSD